LALSKSGEIHEHHELWWVEGHTFLSACLGCITDTSPAVNLLQAPQYSIFVSKKQSGSRRSGSSRKLVCSDVKSGIPTLALSKSG